MTEEQFNIIEKTHTVFLRNFIMKNGINTISSSYEVDDIVQDVMVKVYFSMSPDLEKNQICSFLCKTATNHIIDVSRIEKNKKRKNEDVFSMDGFFKSEVGGEKELEELVFQHDEFRMLTEGFSYQEISDVKKTKLGTIKARINRQRNKIKKEWQSKR